MDTSDQTTACCSDNVQSVGDGSHIAATTVTEVPANDLPASHIGEKPLTSTNTTQDTASSSLLPSTILRRASITFKLRNYNEHQESPEPITAPDASGLLGPKWNGARLSRASSPALSVQSEASDRASSSKGSGTRPATFLFTLTTFLRENPESPYMRWSESGKYFLVPDKAGLMERVIPDLFNQNSYSSFARQLNIYGWRRLQSAPDGKTVGSNCTIWKHDQITRDTPDSDLKHVKRNAQDKSRRNSKGMDDEVEEFEVTTRPRRAVTMSSTTAAEAMAARKAAGASTNLRYSSTRCESPTTSAGTFPPTGQIPSVLAPVPTRTNGPSPAAVLQASHPPNFIQGRLSRPFPMRRPLSRSLSYTSRTVTKRNRETTPESGGSLSSTTTTGTESDDFLDTPLSRARNSNVVPGLDGDGSSKRARLETLGTSGASHDASRIVPNSEHTLRVLPFQLAATRQLVSQNPVDVYVACVDPVTGGSPVFKGRDRIDIPVWMDDYSQARFVLAGEMMRAWALWDVVPPDTLLYIALSEGGKPPRPLGIAQQLRENTANGDPNRAYSRERIYLENSGEPGSVGRCCLIYRSSATEGGNASKKVSASISSGPSLSKLTSEGETWNGAPVAPPTPKIQPQAPTSSERKPLLCETKSGRKISDRFLDSPALPSPAMRTPKTADAISSLAAMQAFARSFTPTPLRDLDTSSPDSTSLNRVFHDPLRLWTISI